MTFSNIIEVFKNEEVVQKFAMSRYNSEEKFYTDTIITENFSYTLFVSPTISKTIQSMSSTSEPRNYVMDATFNVVPTSKDFKQLLIIHFVHCEHTFPFIYVLMSKKSEEAYTHMLHYLKSNILDLQPNRVITDYENGLRNAIKKLYPTVKLVGCWFHYTQALRRKALKIPGFINELNKNNQAKVFFNKFLYLPLLKPNDITAAYQILKADAMDVKYIKGKMTESYFQPFIKYFDSYWMKKEKVTNFSVYKEPIRTSNAAEGFHRQLNMQLPKHGNFYRFLDCLCDLDAVKSSDFLKSISGCISLYTKSNTYLEKRNKFIQKQYQLLREKKITLNTLLGQFSKMKNCMIEESFINTIDSDDDESDTNSSGEDSTDTIEKEQQYLTCIICCERERQILFDPCKHFKLCQPCYQQLKESAKQKGTQTLCPICRAIIKNGTFIYY
ncbi:uncharacterized protein LOC119604655 [Lucilia sericata]|uniref:uncharacterized protein LOC119604655 n=1 Tax=Lucilia sericata TaxID=13632 RepID=UPI0018A8597A|nr:uncharacterized protein LOC119604655 [Lucilia sericata]